MSWIMIEYFCSTCGRVSESLEKRTSTAKSKPCVCGGTGKRCMSAPQVKTVLGWVTRGKSDEPPPGAFTTKHLARD